MVTTLNSQNVSGSDTSSGFFFGGFAAILVGVGVGWLTNGPGMSDVPVIAVDPVDEVITVAPQYRFLSGASYNFTSPPVRTACFAAGTEIRCVRPDGPCTVPVEHLRVGDVVVTYAEGDRAVRHVGEATLVQETLSGVPGPDAWRRRMFRLRRSGPAMTKDLVVTGLHTLFFDTPEPGSRPISIGTGGGTKHAVFAGRSTRLEPSDEHAVGSVEVYHFSLANDGNPHRLFAVWADGMLAESTCEDEFRPGGAFRPT